MSPGLRAALYVAVGLLLLLSLITEYRAYALFTERKSVSRQKAELRCAVDATEAQILHEMKRVRQQNSFRATVWAFVALALASADVALGIYTHYRWGWFSGRGGALTIEIVVALLVAWTIWDNTENEPGWRSFWLAVLCVAILCFGF